MPIIRRVTTPVVLAVVVLMTATSILGYRWMTSSRPVSVVDAVEGYRANTETPAPASETEPLAEAPQTPADAGLDGAPAPDAPTPAAPSAPAATPVPAAAPAMIIPAPGVYTYRTEGWEEAGFRRNYPAESQRVITKKDDRTFANHHIFSREHEEWFTLQATDRGGVMLERRTRVTFGPMTVDRTITFDPPSLGVPVPSAVGQRWQGSWTGPTSGEYAGETIDHRTIRIGNEDVEVWVNRLNMTMRGEVEGEAVITLWHSPRYGLMAREDGNLTMRNGPGTYRSEYTITLTSTQPRT